MKLKELCELDIDILIPMLRSYGIRALSIGDVSLTISPGPNAVKTEWEPSRFEDEREQEKLPCGHSVWEANEKGECLMGCLPETKKEE